MSAKHSDILVEMQPWLRDHSLAGQPVLPAVESLILLANAARTFSSKTDTNEMLAGRFARFLELPDSGKVAAVIELEQVEETVLAVLYSRKKVGSFSRCLEHARVFFANQKNKKKIKKINEIQTKNVPAFRVSGQQIYRELISFGRSYQNVVTADLFPDGVIAKLQTPDIPLPLNPALPGSPFLLDAAFHAACIWGQRFAGFVPFPVGFKRRQIFLPSRPGKQYQSKITVTARAENELTFDMDILDPDGTRMEHVQGLQMRDVSNGRIKPPAWMQA